MHPGKDVQADATKDRYAGLFSKDLPPIETTPGGTAAVRIRNGAGGFAPFGLVS